MALDNPLERIRKLDEINEKVCPMVWEKRYSELEKELRAVDIATIDTTLLLGYLTAIVVVPDEDFPFAQEFRDRAIAIIQSKPNYRKGLTEGLEKYSSVARAAGEILQANGLRIY